VGGKLGRGGLAVAACLSATAAGEVAVPHECLDILAGYLKMADWTVQTEHVER
jgi:hypothetical protein